MANKDGFVYRLDATPSFNVLEPTDGNKFSVVLGVSDTDGSDNWIAGGMMSCELTVGCGGNPACKSYARGQYWTDDSTTANNLKESGLCTGSVIPRTVGFAVSAGGTIVGLGNNPNDPTEAGYRWAFVWESGPSSVPEELPKLSGSDEDAAYDIRVPTSGPMEIVGGSFFLQALLWRHNGTDWSDDPINLDDVSVACKAGTFGTLQRATGINSSGWICGWGDNGCGDTQAFVLVPYDQYTICPGDIANSGPCGGPGSECPDGAVNVFDLLELLSNWDTDRPGANIAVPHNDVVDVFDLVELLSEWGLCIEGSSATVNSLEYEVTNAGLTMDDWDDYMDVVTDEYEDEKVKANWRVRRRRICLRHDWMQNYISDCTTCPACPFADPFE
jgi:hypothetical protein